MPWIASNCSRSVGKISAKHRVQRAVVLFDHEFQQIPQPPGFHLVVAGRANQLGQFLGRQRVQRMRLHHARVAQIGDRPLDISPGRVLHEHGADHDFERRLARPPVLWTKRGVEVARTQ